MNDAYIFDAIRTPIGRYGGSLSSVRTDNLASLPLKELVIRNLNVDWSTVDDILMGCANQAGEDNRNVARMASLLAGLPVDVPGTTINRLCGSGMDAIGYAARSIKSGETGMMIAGGVESMSRAPFVSPKATSAFSRENTLFDSTIGWRFVNQIMQHNYGVDSMPETAENVAKEFNISREDQDAFAFRSQQKTKAAQDSGFFKTEIAAVAVPSKKNGDTIVDIDEHPRANTTLESLGKLRAPFRANGTITAGNASGINDGACALLLGNDAIAKKYQLTPIARVVSMATVGVEPRIMGFGPAPATEKVLKLAGLKLSQMDVIELNEAFAAQALAVTRYLKLDDDAEHVNPNGGAISLGHPLGMSGARLVTTAINQLHRTNGRFALCTMCIGVGQGIAVIIENTRL
jgi:3-oxoadipyl-CoA thiolase